MFAFHDQYTKPRAIINPKTAATFFRGMPEESFSLIDVT